MNRTIDVLIFEGVNLLDIAGPAQAFHEANLLGTPHYRTRYVSRDGQSVVASCGLEIVAHGQIGKQRGGTDLLIPGGAGIDEALSSRCFVRPISRWIDKQPGGRVISVCSGALLLAQTGLLDGRCATTHWVRRNEVQRWFPKVNWQVDRIFVCDDQFYTSAGVTAGIDLALSIIKEDMGPQNALKVAQELVVYLHRPGGQSQFAGMLDAQFLAHGSLTRLINHITSAPAMDWTLSRMADEAGMTSRTLSRRFTESLQTSPLKFVERLRVAHASNLLVAGSPPSKAATQSGFGDLQRMQRAFVRQYGMTVPAYVARFTASPTS